MYENCKSNPKSSPVILPMVFMVALTAACGKRASDSSVEGWPAATTAQVRGPYILYIAAPNVAGISDFIQESQPALSVEQSDELAENIISVAECFRIDARILASQIRQESLFNARAESIWYYNGDPAAQQHYRDVILAKAPTIL